MKTIKHGENLIQLSHLGFVNCYLVREEDGLTLIDTAMRGCGKATLQAAQQEAFVARQQKRRSNSNIIQVIK